MRNGKASWRTPAGLVAATALSLLGGMLSAQQAAGQEADDAADGEWRYDVSCATCHGESGEGIYAFGVALRGNAFVQNAPDEALLQVIRQGRFNRGRAYPDYPGMPGFEYIRGDEARALLAYLRGPLQEP